MRNSETGASCFRSPALHIAICDGVGFGLLRFIIACVPALALRGERAALLALARGAWWLGRRLLLLTGLQRYRYCASFAIAALRAAGPDAGRRRALSPRVLAVAAAVVLLIRP